MARTTSSIGELIADHPCLQCLTPKDKLIVLVYLLATANSLTLPDDITTLMEDSACDSCSPDTRLLDGVISALWTQYANATSLDDIKTAGTCLQCASDRKLRELVTYLTLMYVEGLAPV